MSALLVAGIAGMSPSLKAAKGADTLNPVLRLLSEAQTNSSQISVDWKSCVRQPNSNWTRDAGEIARMKDDINAAAKTILSLNDFRNQASPSQAATIDQIVPVMEELADHATDAIEYLSGNQTRLTDKEYRKYLEANSDTSSRLAGLITQLVEFGNGRDKFENAKRMLELTEK
jgi:hypothetical protein